MTTYTHFPTVDEKLLKDVESFLESDNRATDNDMEAATLTLDDVSVQIQESIGNINMALKNSVRALTSPLQDGDAVERYMALVEANRLQYRAWKDLGEIADIIGHYRHMWRDDGDKIMETIRAYATVFDFPLPDELKPSESPDSSDFTTNDGVPF